MVQRVHVLEMLVRESGTTRIALSGDSMWPLLRDGMIAEIVKPTERERPGDILVYKGTRGLVAHRLIRFDGTNYVTCGDAHPHSLEHVKPSELLGVVVSIWSGPEDDSRRIDRGAFAMLSRMMRVTRPLRALLVVAYEWLRLFVRLPRPGTIFQEVVLASIEFERGDILRGVRLLEKAPLQPLLDVVKQHGLAGFLYEWLSNARRDGISINDSLWESIKAIRWGTALIASRTEVVIGDAVGKLRAAGIDSVVLKGGARLLRGGPQADLHFSSDIDLLVGRDVVDRAIEVLVNDGYRHEHVTKRIEKYDKHHHHKAPLWFPGFTTPVELHVALSQPGTTSLQLDYRTLRSQIEPVNAERESIHVLSTSAAALHLAYHARDFKKFRDVLLLARSFAAMTPDERASFERLGGSEKKDRVRLRSAVAFADFLSGRRIADPAIRRYIAWALFREDLPARLAKRSRLLETFHARSGLYWRNTAFAGGQFIRFAFDVIAWPVFRRWTRAADALPIRAELLKTLHAEKLEM